MPSYRDEQILNVVHGLGEAFDLPPNLKLGLLNGDIDAIIDVLSHLSNAVTQIKENPAPCYTDHESRLQQLENKTIGEI